MLTKRIEKKLDSNYTRMNKKEYSGYDTKLHWVVWMRPAKVGALASVFEKSATELKQSKLLKCKQTLQIATFNVRTLNRIGQLPELIASAEEH